MASVANVSAIRLATRHGRRPVRRRQKTIRGYCRSNWKAPVRHQGLVVHKLKYLTTSCGELQLQFNHVRELAMPTGRAFIGCALLIFGLSFTHAQQITVLPDNLFTASGFIVKYATTPEKSAILRSLPPDKLVKRTKNGKLYYVYADAAGCNCAYVGTPEAYAAYQNGATIGPSGGGPSNAMQTIDSNVGAPYIPANIGPSMDTILSPDF